jgi:hypothetical protein
MLMTILAGAVILTASVLLVLVEVVPSPRLCRALSCGKGWPPEAAPIFGSHYTWAQLGVLAVGVGAFLGSITFACIKPIRANGGAST